MFIFALIEGVLTSSFMAINLSIMGTKFIYRMIYGKPKTDLEKFIEWYEENENNKIKVKDKKNKLNNECEFKITRRAST